MSSAARHRPPSSAIVRHRPPSSAIVLKEPPMTNSTSSPPRSVPHEPRNPRGLLKWAFNVPRLIYRLHLGWLLGRHFLQLTHRGRRSGRIRHTVLEVARFDPQTHESVVLSAYGDRADWYRNVHVAPALEIRTGRSRYVPEQRQLDPDERYAVLAAYRRRYGPLLGFFLRYMGYTYTGKEDELSAIAARVHAVGFRPRAPTSPAAINTQDVDAIEAS
jgi:deazaflavin-dependent oxidoreductase (nitroreductase family)